MHESNDGRPHRRRGRPPTYDLLTVRWWVAKQVRDHKIGRTEARLRAAEKFGFGGAKEQSQIAERVRNIEVRAQHMWLRARQRAVEDPEPDDEEMRFLYGAIVDRGRQDGVRDER